MQQTTIQSITGGGVLNFMNLNNLLFLEIKIRRENILEDTLNQLINKGKSKQLNKPFKVVFLGEPGVDGGGI